MCDDDGSHVIHSEGVSLFCWSSDSMYVVIVIYHHKDGMLLFKCLLDGIVYYI